jgi:hypothetical protein
MESCSGSPNGVRTRVSTLRGWCPRPLDDGAKILDVRDPHPCCRENKAATPHRFCSGGRTRTPNNRARTCRVANYTTPDRVRAHPMRDVRRPRLARRPPTSSPTSRCRNRSPCQRQRPTSPEGATRSAKRRSSSKPEARRPRVPDRRSQRRIPCTAH